MKKLLLFVSVLLLSVGVKAQYEKIKEYSTFGLRLDNAIKVNGEKNGDKIAFFAENRSNYPYVVEISFTNLENMEPYTTFKRQLVFPGKHKIVEFKKRNADQGFNYQYQTKYYIGSNKEADRLFPYLIPLKEGTEIIPYKRMANSNTYLVNHFTMQPGDTIYCMRKGRVLATPNMYHNGDRISQKRSIEVMHADGTIMMYENINLDIELVRQQEVVYPGQPIGLVNQGGFLRVGLYECLDGGMIKSIPFLYIRHDRQAENFNNSFLETSVKHPIEIKTKELTRREKKRLKSGKLVL